MSDLLKQAYASASEAPILTVRLLHSGLTGGERAFVRGVGDLTANIETGESITFERTGMNVVRPNKNVSGRQDLNFQLSNINREAWQELKSVITANRTDLSAGNSPEKLMLEYREFLLSDLSEPQGPVYKMPVVATEIDLLTLTLTASFWPMIDVSWPRYRYYPELFPGVRYA